MTLRSHNLTAHWDRSDIDFKEGDREKDKGRNERRSDQKENKELLKSSHHSLLPSMRLVDHHWVKTTKSAAYTVKLLILYR